MYFKSQVVYITEISKEGSLKWNRIPVSVSLWSPKGTVAHFASYFVFMTTAANFAFCFLSVCTLLCLVFLS